MIQPSIYYLKQKQKTDNILLIPANENLIKGINKARQTIAMEIPDGLLEL